MTDEEGKKLRGRERKNRSLEGKKVREYEGIQQNKA
jgi:hypothetical protein